MNCRFGNLKAYRRCKINAMMWYKEGENQRTDSSTLFISLQGGILQITPSFLSKTQALAIFSLET
jgi:hypothetical protein